MTMTSINEKTSVPLKIVVPICVTIASCSLYLGLEMASIKSLLKQMWTVDDMARWGYDASSANPNWKASDPYKITRERRNP